MIEKIDRNYLEIKSINDLIENSLIRSDFSIDLEKIVDFQVNKFFYKNVGKKHKWKDRLTWSEEEWIKYVSNPKVQTYILKLKNDFAGYFELIIHSQEIEIAYFGLLEEYHNKKLGGFLLSEAIKKSFLNFTNSHQTGGLSNNYLDDKSLNNTKIVSNQQTSGLTQLNSLLNKNFLYVTLM